MCVPIRRSCLPLDHCVCVSVFSMSALCIERLQHDADSVAYMHSIDPASFMLPTTWMENATLEYSLCARHMGHKTSALVILVCAMPTLSFATLFRRYNALVYVPYQLERLLLFGVLLCFDSFLV